MPHATILCSIGVQNQTQKRAPAAPFETPVLACLGMAEEDSTSPFLPLRLAPRALDNSQGDSYDIHILLWSFYRRVVSPAPFYTAHPNPTSGLVRFGLRKAFR